jgi:tetratricopeptide (TPR) repeat protein
VLELYRRAYDLAEQVGDTQQRLVAVQGLLSAILLQGNPAAAHELAQRELALAAGTGDHRLIVDARFDLGLTLEHLGRWAEARTHYEAMLALRDDEWDRTVSCDPVPEGPILCRRHLAITLWHLGCPDQALGARR